jgi:hypothetical protein
MKMMYCLIICKLRSFPSEGVNREYKRGKNHCTVDLLLD